jgi:hypothetical protein
MVDDDSFVPPLHAASTMASTATGTTRRWRIPQIYGSTFIRWLRAPGLSLTA